MMRDDGMVYHKAHDYKWTGLAVAPYDKNEGDKENKAPMRIVKPVTYAATLNASATFAQAARLFKDYDAAYAKTMEDAAIKTYAAAQKKVEENGDEFIFVDAKMSPEEYLKAIDNAIANQAKGIVTCIPDQTMSQAAVDKCKEAGIPIVAADDALQNDAGEKIAPWVGINAYVIGQANGDWLAAYAKDNGLVEDETSGLLILTMDTVSSCVPRAEGEYDNFTAGCPDFPTERIFKADYDGMISSKNFSIFCWSFPKKSLPLQT